MIVDDKKMTEEKRTMVYVVSDDNLGGKKFLGIGLFSEKELQLLRKEYPKLVFGILREAQWVPLKKESE